MLYRASKYFAGIAALALLLSLGVLPAFAFQNPATDTDANTKKTKKSKKKATEKKTEDNTASTPTPAPTPAPAPAPEKKKSWFSKKNKDTKTATPPPAAATTTPATPPPAAPAATPPPAKTTKATPPPAAAQPGQVWVNLDSGVYHKGGRWYGKTKNGKFMSEADAVKAGYHEDKNEAKKK